MYRAMNLLNVDNHPLFCHGIRWNMNEDQRVKVLGDVAPAEDDE